MGIRIRNIFLLNVFHVATFAVDFAQHKITGAVAYIYKHKSRLSCILISKCKTRNFEIHRIVVNSLVCLLKTNRIIVL